MHVKELHIDSAVKFLLAQQQNTSTNSIHFITHPSIQDVVTGSRPIQLATLQSESDLQSTTNDVTAIQIAQNKDDVFSSFQIQDKIRPDLLDLVSERYSYHLMIFPCSSEDFEILIIKARENYECVKLSES